MTKEEKLAQRYGREIDERIPQEQDWRIECDQNLKKHTSRGSELVNMVVAFWNVCNIWLLAFALKFSLQVVSYLCVMISRHRREWLIDPSFQFGI